MNLWRGEGPGCRGADLFDDDALADRVAIGVDTQLERVDTQLERVDAKLGRVHTQLGRVDAQPGRVDAQLGTC
jgi:hypothetical protein